MAKRPNVVFVFADQMREDVLDDPQVSTPAMARLAAEGVRFTNAVACAPVCSPYRASLLTGQYPLTTGVFVNDVRLGTQAPSIAHVFGAAGYRTAYIGKWHLDGTRRGGFTPPGPRRQGFDFWAVANCTHNYMHSHYYRDTPERLYWEGYDAIAQTRMAVEYIEEMRGQHQPFCLFLSWGPPHNPYREAPAEYLARYDPASIRLKPNCEDDSPENRAGLAGYYAHVTALDTCLARLRASVDDETIFVFTSDHGDMLGSHGVYRKQWPWAESARVPFLLACPEQASEGLRVAAPFNVTDVMPTLLELARLDVPETVEGVGFARAVRGESLAAPDSAWITSVAPFAENAGPEWRGVKTERHTYVRTREGPWLLYDDEADPDQLENLADRDDQASLRATLDGMITQWLDRTGDRFLSAADHLAHYGIEVGPHGSVPYTDGDV